MKVFIKCYLLHETHLLNRPKHSNWFSFAGKDTFLKSTTNNENQRIIWQIDNKFKKKESEIYFFTFLNKCFNKIFIEYNKKTLKRKKKLSNFSY